MATRLAGDRSSILAALSTGTRLLVGSAEEPQRLREILLLWWPVAGGSDRHTVAWVTYSPGVLVQVEYVTSWSTLMTRG